MRGAPLFVALYMAACTSPPPKPSDVQPDPPLFQKAVRGLTGTTVSWKNIPDEDFELTLVAKYSGPADGRPGPTVPPVRAPLGSGVVMFTGTETGFVDPILPLACQVLRYQLFSRDRAGQWSAPVEALVSGSSPPTGVVSQLTASARDGRVQLAWLSPTGHTRLVRDGVIVYQGEDSSFSEPLAPGATATFTAFVCNACGACAEQGVSVTSIAAPPADLDAGHELRPTTVFVGASGGTVSVTWGVGQEDGGLTHVKVLRRLDVRVEGPDDSNAALVFEGAGATATDRVDALLPSPHAGWYAVYGCRGSYCEPNGAHASLLVSLDAALKAGGYVIWFRHATATTCMDQSSLGTANDWWKSCDSNCATATARQLTPPQSTAEISAIRSAFTSRGWQVSRVQTTEFCRGVQTAEQLAFGPPIEQRHDLTFFVYDEANRCANARALLNVPPAPGANAVIVSHAGFACPVLDALASAEAAIFKPGDAGTLFIRRMPHSDWDKLP